MGNAQDKASAGADKSNKRLTISMLTGMDF
jgi:hypothetical protein